MVDWACRIQHSMLWFSVYGFSTILSLLPSLHECHVSSKSRDGEQDVDYGKILVLRHSFIVTFNPYLYSYFCNCYHCINMINTVFKRLETEVPGERGLLQEPGINWWNAHQTGGVAEANGLGFGEPFWGFFVVFFKFRDGLPPFSIFQRIGVVQYSHRHLNVTVAGCWDGKGAGANEGEAAVRQTLYWEIWWEGGRVESEWAFNISELKTHMYIFLFLKSAELTREFLFHYYKHYNVL